MTRKQLTTTLAQIGVVTASLILLYIVSMCMAFLVIVKTSESHNRELPRVQRYFDRK